MQTQTASISQISRLLSAFPASNSQDPEALVIRYIEAIAEHDIGDIVNAVTRYITANVPGFDGRFAPTPPMLAAQCQQSARTRLEAEAAEEHRRRALAAPEPDDWQNPPPEVRLEKKAVLSKLVVELAEADPSAPTERDKADADRKVAERWAKVNSYHQPDMSPEAVAKRLGLPFNPPRHSHDTNTGEAA